MSLPFLTFFDSAKKKKLNIRSNSEKKINQGFFVTLILYIINIEISFMMQILLE